MRVKDAEADAREEGKDIAATKSQIGIGGEKRIREQRRRIVVGINRLRREIIGANGSIRRQREGDQFVNANTGARESTIQAGYRALGVSPFGTINDRGLLHGSAQFSRADDFIGILKAAAKFTFGAGTTSGKHGSNRNRTQERKKISHSFGLLVQNKPARAAL